MKGQTTPKVKSHTANDRMGMLGILITVLVLLAVMLSRSRALEVTVDSFKRRQAELEELVRLEEERTKEIESLKEYMLTDEYAEQTARERLGLVKENEIVFEEVQ